LILSVFYALRHQQKDICPLRKREFISFSG